MAKHESKATLVVVETTTRTVMGVLRGSPSVLRAAIRDGNAVEIQDAIVITMNMVPMPVQGNNLVSSAGGPVERQMTMSPLPVFHMLDVCAAPVPLYTCHPMAGYAVDDLPEVLRVPYYANHMAACRQGAEAIKAREEASAKLAEKEAESAKSDE